MTDEELIASLWLDSADKAKIMRHIREAELRGVKAGLEAGASWLLSDEARIDYEASGSEEHFSWWAADRFRAIGHATVEVG